MHSNEQVTFVRYGFSASALFERYDKLNRYDQPASTRKYAELCTRRLQAEYPRATVEVVSVEGNDEGILPGPMQTRVLVSAGDEIDSPVPLELEDPDLVEDVKQHCEEIFKCYEWLVPRPWLGLEEACQRFQISISVLRWLCSHGFISEAERSPSEWWEFPQESLVDFRREHRGLFDPGATLSALSDESGVVSFKSYPRGVLFAANWPAPGETWIAPTVQLDLPFRPEDWSLLVDQQSVVLEHHFRATDWEREIVWTYPHYAKAMISEADACGIESELAQDTQMVFKSARSPHSQLTPHQCAQHLAKKLNQAHQNAIVVLSGGPLWKPEYEKDEDLFCREILEPLLRRMGYRDIRYTHGQDEYGRDFVFSEETRFGDLQYYAVQAKAGNVSGSVNANLKEIFDQLDDVFKMAYTEPGRPPVHIGVCIVAISGQFTKNAEDKIRQKVPKMGIPVGAVYFWDKAKVLSLIRQYWGNIPRPKNYPTFEGG